MANTGRIGKRRLLQEKGTEEKEGREGYSELTINRTQHGTE